jgi:two-component system, sporulation sensor kinase B
MVPGTGLELTRLLSLISHEIRGPLGVIRGYLRLLEQQGAALSDTHRQAVAGALKASDRATEILAQVSTLARLERGDGGPNLTPTPLHQLLESAEQGLILASRPRVTLERGAIADVSVGADLPLLRTALTALIAAVVRAQTADTDLHLLARERENGMRRGVAVTITAMPPGDEVPLEEPLDVSRGGLGFDLPLAVFVVAAHGGTIREYNSHSRLLGVVVWLPIA